ncbi:PASTA domain-containing protein [Deinococcus sonorensis]|uniref:PASTA domain-containing protein n=2 Tax=Deinococcus sonorensis TaxID=309891 RepID=A0AAU7U8C2_9DEIO
MTRSDVQGPETRIDGKYLVLSEVSREDQTVLYTVQQEGREPLLRLGWFEVTGPAERSFFHRYRSALKALSPAGLVDVVARPGAYYAVWRPLEGQPLAQFLDLPVRHEDAVQAVRDLGTQLAEHGFSLTDAEVLLDPDGQPQLAYLAPRQHTLEEAVQLNTQLLTPLGRGRVRRRRPVLSVWAVLPGLLFLGGAGYLGVQAARIYLNPPSRTVQKVVGQPAEQAAQTLAGDGFRVAYATGEGPGLPVGAVVSQDPAAGSDLPVGRQITLTVNNPPSLTVPRLEELNLDQVQAQLAENRLTRGAVMTVDGTFSGTPKGRVIAQLPEAGATAQRGDKVTLLVSGGTSKLTWLPPLTGLAFDDARDLARRAGLVVNRVRRQASNARENTVLSQDPAPYVRVEVGAPVTLTIAMAPYTGPSRPADSLPLPPPVYTPPATTETTEPSVPDTTDTPTTTVDSIPAVPQDTAPATVSPSVPALTATETQAQPAQTQARTVQLSYTFPATLPSGTVEIVVRDLDGERPVLAPTATGTVTGASAQQDGIQVRGDAVFVVRVNGQDYTSFPAQ